MQMFLSTIILTFELACSLIILTKLSRIENTTSSELLLLRATKSIYNLFLKMFEAWN